MSKTSRRVVITGMGLVSPLGNDCDTLWNALTSGHSGVAPLSRLPIGSLPTAVAGEAKFTGAIEEFGPLEKSLQRNIKKGLKLMCREIQMGVAAAQLAIHHAGLTANAYPAERVGTMFGSDYIISEPYEFCRGVVACLQDGKFQFDQWGEVGLKQVEPLWLLKYLPNMPASHVAIFNDYRGPSNSITLREASSNLSVAESVTTIRRGTADAIVVGSTGSRVHAMKTLHVALQESLAHGGANPAKACRPFDAQREGMVLGEGAGVMVLESLESAQQRGAMIWGEVIGYASSTVANRRGVADFETAFANVIELALRQSELSPDQIGHVHAHGLGTREMDACEGLAILRTLGQVPVTTAKSYMGNLGAGSGMVEMIASVLALHHNQLFPILNYENVDPQIPIHAVRELQSSVGDVFLNLNCSPQGQASAVVIRRYSA